MGPGSSGQDWEKTYPPAHARVNLGWEEESVGLLDKDFCTYVVVGLECPVTVLYAKGRKEAIQKTLWKPHCCRKPLRQWAFSPEQRENKCLTVLTHQCCRNAVQGEGGTYHPHFLHAMENPKLYQNLFTTQARGKREAF